MILTYLFLPLIFIVFNAILFYHLGVYFNYSVREKDAIVLLINFLVLIVLSFINLKLSFEYLIITFLFFILFIA